MQYSTLLGSATLLALAALTGPAQAAEELAVKITSKLSSLTVQHEGQAVTILRNQDEAHQIDPQYAKTSRKCPPFCVTPAKTGDAETIGELEVLDYLKKINEGDKSILLVDSRSREWIAHGTIPGAINVPWMKISPENEQAGFEASGISARDTILSEVFGAKKTESGWDFSAAKTLVLFCNGLWCAQSLTNIDSLRQLGYPADKLKWYRGGMQDWEVLGLTTVKTAPSH